VTDVRDVASEVRSDDPYRRLERRIHDRSAVIGVIGLGYVGLPLALGFARHGYRIVGVDLDETKVGTLRSGTSTIADVGDVEIAEVVGDGRLDASTDYATLASVDVAFICVPTPFTAMKSPDLAFVEDAARRLAEVMRSGQLVVLQSTTYPGTTEEIVQPVIERTGLRIGEDVFLAFSPERIDPGHTSSAGFDVENTPKVVGGVTSRCVELASALLSQMIASVHQVSSPRAAEMTKLLENTFRSVNIALVNELALLAERMDIDIWEVIDAAATKPFGFMAFRPGPGVGGHCIPVDPFYLSWKAREFDYWTKFIELAAEVNSDMPRHVVDLVAAALNRSGRSLNGSSVLLVGVAFKPEVDDPRNSPAEPIAQLLARAGAGVRYHDEFVPRFTVPGGARAADTVLESQPLTAEVVGSADCVVVLTAHRSLPVDHLVEHARVVVDTVNATAGRDDERILRLGAPGTPDGTGRPVAG
jgi:UDP-N-acetyl-D-glucosamine dehydrogenase